ncbi:MAG: hypothetical protein ACO39X_08320, partial [Candidatus Nanopelagicaceae bacterium]
MSELLRLPPERLKCEPLSDNFAPNLLQLIAKLRLFEGVIGIWWGRYAVIPAIALGARILRLTLSP